MKFINLTPHDVTLANGSLKVLFKKDLGTPTARVEQLVEVQTIQCEVAPGMFLDMPVNTVTRATVYGLPEPTEGVTYICSSMVASYVRRPDVISPNTDATCERDASGRVISVKGFQRYNQDFMPKPQELTTVEESLQEMEQEPEVMESSEEEYVPAAPVQKVDMDMLDPIKAAAKMRYEKRVAKRK